MCEHELSVGLTGMFFNEDNKCLSEYGFWDQRIPMFILHFGIIAAFLLCVHVGKCLASSWVFLVYIYVSP